MNTFQYKFYKKFKILKTSTMLVVDVSPNSHKATPIQFNHCKTKRRNQDNFSDQLKLFFQIQYSPGMEQTSFNVGDCN